MSSHTEPEIIQKTEKVTSYGYVVKSSNITVLDSSIKMAFKLFDAKINERNIEDELRISEEKYRSLTEAMKDVVIRISPTGKLIYISPSVTEFGGYNPEKEIGNYISNYFEYKSELLEALKLLNKVLITKESGNFKFTFKAKNRVPFPVEHTYMPLVKDGKVYAIQMVLRDITDRSQAESNIKKQQKLNELLLNSMPYPIMYINKKRIVKAANKIALDVGVKIGDYCWKGFGKCECLSEENERRAKNNPDNPGIRCTFCRMDEIFKNNKPANDPNVNAFGRIWDTFWIPLNEEGYLHYSIDITERKQAEDKIKQLLSEKNMLLIEVHHRIKNNMQVLRSLLSMQARKSKIPEVVSAFKDSIARIESMGVLYDKLYRTENYEKASIKEYFTQLIDEIVLMFPCKQKIKIEKQIDNFFIESKIIFSLGLIINELLTNAMKYAFTGRDKGVIKVLAKKDNNHVILIFQDNGIGISEQESKEGKGFGITLIDMLVMQIKGNYRIENTNGTKYTIEFDI